MSFPETKTLKTIEKYQTFHIPIQNQLINAYVGARILLQTKLEEFQVP